DFHRETDRLSRLNPSLADVISEVQMAASEFAAATGKVNAFNAAVEVFANTTAKTSRTAPLSDFNFEDRFSGFEDTKKKLESQRKELENASKPKKEKAERDNDYERLTKSIADRTAAMIAETEAVRQLDPTIDD